MAYKRRSAALALSATAAVLVTGCSSSSEAAPIISTQGTGIVNGSPDTVTVGLGVQTQAVDATAALNANAQRATALIETIKSKGVDGQDITTSHLSVQPNYQPDGTIAGYVVTNQVTATLREVSKSGALIDAAASAAGDAIRVQQLTFSIADDSALRAQARAQAVKQAQGQAKQIADAAGVQLGDLQSITESPAAGATPFPQSMSVADGEVSTPIEAGSQELSVSVAVSYAID